MSNQGSLRLPASISVKWEGQVVTIPINNYLALCRHGHVYRRALPTDMPRIIADPFIGLMPDDGCYLQSLEYDYDRT